MATSEPSPLPQHIPYHVMGAGSPCSVTSMIKIAGGQPVVAQMTHCTCRNPAHLTDGCVDSTEVAARDGLLALWELIAVRMGIWLPLACGACSEIAAEAYGRPASRSDPLHWVVVSSTSPNPSVAPRPPQQP